MSQMPPTNTAPGDLWLQITQTPRPHRLVDFPRKDSEGKPLCQLAIVPATQHETQAATLSTEKWVRKLLKDEGALPSSSERSQGYDTLYENRATLEVLFRTCKKADDISKSFFPSIEQIAEKLTTDEVAVLWRSYLMVRSEVGPIVAYMSQDEYDAWVEVLAKGGSLYPLASLTLGLQIELLQRMAVELLSLRTDNTSPGTQPEEPTSTP